MVDWLKSKMHRPRKGMPSPRLDEAEFKRRFRLQYTDPAFAPISCELAKVTEAAWDAYKNSRKSPDTRKAGSGFADPDYDLAIDWINAHEAIAAAQRQHDMAAAPRRILLINGSPRSEHTCPGEMSKSYRLVEIAERTFRDAALDVSILDLSRVTSEYGRHIH